MNASKLLTDLKMDLGIYSLRLPFEDPDKTLMDVVINRTIPIFSTSLPDIITMEFSAGDILEVESMGNEKGEYKSSNGQEGDIDIKRTGNYMTIRLPEFMDRDILFVRDIKYHNPARIGYAGATGRYGLYDSMMMGKATADLMTSVSPPVTFEFIAPNMVKVYNVGLMAYNMIMEIAVTHAPNLSTITRTSEESFYKLALLDVKRFLYHAMKHYTELSTAFGNVNLKIDDWADAESERQSLLDQWDDVYQLELTQMHII